MPILWESGSLDFGVPTEEEAKKLDRQRVPSNTCANQLRNSTTVYNNKKSISSLDYEKLPVRYYDKKIFQEKVSVKGLEPSLVISGAENQSQNFLSTAKLLSSHDQASQDRSFYQNSTTIIQSI